MKLFKDEFRAIFYVKDYEANVKFYGEGLELESNYSWNDAPADRRRFPGDHPQRAASSTRSSKHYDRG